MVGGDHKTFDICKPLLQHLGTNVFHVGCTAPENTSTY
jgi:3-hydroxyisobutyrate dehydrogenase-like beta-hydroxyacid dehydrogenase